MLKSDSECQIIFIKMSLSKLKREIEESYVPIVVMCQLTGRVGRVIGPQLGSFPGQVPCCLPYNA